MRFFKQHCHPHSDEVGRRFARADHHGRHSLHERMEGLHERMEGRFGRGGRLARLLEHGDLRMLVLHLINEKPRHGYEIIKAIEDLASGAYAPSPGVVYPTLTMLEELGQVDSTAEGNRKSYAITEAGRQALAENQGVVNTILARIAASQPRDAILPVLRATANLKTTLRMTLGARQTAAEKIRKITDILDKAARDIEDLP